MFLHQIEHDGEIHEFASSVPALNCVTVQFIPAPRGEEGSRMKYGIYPIVKAFLVGNDYKDAEILFECEELGIGDVIEHNGKRYVVSFTTNFDFSGIREIDSEDQGDEDVYCDSMMKCPFCGYEDPQSYEHGDSEEELECGRCSAVFSFEREISVSYTTKIVKPPKIVKIPNNAPQV